MAYNREELLKILAERGVSYNSQSQPSQNPNINSGYNRQDLEKILAERNTPVAPPQEQQLSNPSNLGMRLLGDIASGMAQGGRAIRNAPYNITNAISPETAEKIANSGWAGKHLFAPDTRELYKFGVNDPKFLDKLIQGGISAGPIAVLAGGPVASLTKSPLLGAMAGGTVSGAITDEENPLLGAALGAGLGAAGTGVGKLINTFRNARPQTIANEFIKKYGKEGLEEIERPAKQLWKKVNEAGNENIYNRISPTQRQTTAAHAKYSEKLGKEGRFDDLRKFFEENPNLENTHKLQSEIGAEIGDLNTAKAIEGKLSSSDWTRYRELKNIRNDLLSDINKYLESVSPELKSAYQQASKMHKDVVVPARNAAKIKRKVTSGIDQSIKPTKLSEALEKATNEEILGYKPLPEDVLTLAKKLEKNISNKRKLSIGIPSSVAIGSAGAIPYHKVSLIRHLLGY